LGPVSWMWCWVHQTVITWSNMTKRLDLVAIFYPSLQNISIFGWNCPRKYRPMLNFAPCFMDVILSSSVSHNMVKFHETFLRKFVIFKWSIPKFETRNRQLFKRRWTMLLTYKYSIYIPIYEDGSVIAF